MAGKGEALFNLNVGMTHDWRQIVGRHVRNRFTITVGRPGANDMIFGAVQGPEHLMEDPQLETKVWGPILPNRQIAPGPRIRFNVFEPMPPGGTNIDTVVELAGMAIKRVLAAESVAVQGDTPAEIGPEAQ